ncbi:MAG: type II secretion system protein [Kiritimatiellia bacterium]
MRKNRTGFTLIEMLVVLGIIAVLSSALLVGFGRITKTAQRARAQETVSNVATALGIMLQKKGVWPTDHKNALKTYGGQDGEGRGCVEDVAKVFVKYGLMGISYTGSTYEPQLKGSDRCGIVDPWAVAVLKRSPSNNHSTKVPSGGTVRSHIIYYAIDEDLDGITEAKVCGEEIKVRASAIAWGAGGDGELGDSYSKRSKKNADNVYSWRKNQEVR